MASGMSTPTMSVYLRCARVKRRKGNSRLSSRVRRRLGRRGPLSRSRLRLDMDVRFLSLLLGALLLILLCSCCV